MDADKMYWEKAKRELHKNATSSIEQMLKQHPTKQQLYSRLPPISKTISKTIQGRRKKTLPEKQEWTLDPFTWTCHSCPTNKNFVRTQDVVWKTYEERWMIGTNEARPSGKSVPAARLEDDDDDDN